MNWTTLLHSFTATVDTIQNNAFKDLKAFLNNEIFGPAGPTKQFQGESTHLLVRKVELGGHGELALDVLISGPVALPVLPAGGQLRAHQPIARRFEHLRTPLLVLELFFLPRRLVIDLVDLLFDVLLATIGRKRIHARAQRNHTQS